MSRAEILDANDSLDRWLPRILLVLVALAALARLWLTFRRLYDPDELQHLHAGYCVWRGMLPYRDFFEQHQPVLWYVSLPLFMVWGDSLSVLFAGRFLIWLVGIATLGLTWYLGRRFFGRWGGSIAALLLVLHPPFQEKNIEWRPDNLAVPLLLLAILFLDRSMAARTWFHGMSAGACLGASFFCTQKIAYAATGLLFSFFWCLKRAASPGNAPQVWYDRYRSLGALSAGAGVVALGVLAYFWQQGILGPFWQLTVVAPLQWKTSEDMTRYVVRQLTEGVVFWGAGAAGWWLSAWDTLRVPFRSPGVALILGAALTHALGLFHVPAAFYQYYLPLSPLVAILGARAFVELIDSNLHLVRRRENSSRSEISATCSRTRVVIAFLRVVIAFLLGATVMGIAVLFRSRITIFSSAWTLAMVAMLLFAGICAALGYRRGGVLVTLASSVVGAAVFHMVQFRWDHTPQTNRIKQLLEATSPDDRFFDGFTGYGALRPHAFYYFWINHHSWPMIPAADRQSALRAALLDDRTRIVLFDQNLRRHLPPDAIEIVHQHFEPDLRYSDLPIVLVLVRRDRPLAWDHSRDAKDAKAEAFGTFEARSTAIRFVGSGIDP